MATGAQYDRLKKDTHDDERDDDISVADSHDTFAESHEPNATDAIVVVRRCRAPALRHSVQHAGSFAERHGTASCASHAATPSLATDLIESHTTQPALIPATPDYSTRSPEHSASQSPGCGRAPSGAALAQGRKPAASSTNSRATTARADPKKSAAKPAATAASRSIQ